MELNEKDRVINLDTLKARVFDEISAAIADDKVDGQTLVNAVILSNKIVGIVDEIGSDRVRGDEHGKQTNV